MSAKTLVKIDHWTGMKLTIQATMGMSELCNLRIENEAVRLELALDINELKALREGIDQAIKHCAG
jgi:hypothetical protein